MSTKLSEQDLTDYALDELGPEERIYVETMLAASEESREDVYQLIDLAMTLDQGFEKQQSREPAVLTVKQRRALMSLPAPTIFLRNSAVAMAAAACVAVAFIQRDAWVPRLQLPQATASAKAATKAGMQTSAAGSQTDFVAQIMQVRQLTDDPLLRKWFQSLPGVSSPAPAVGFDSSSSAKFESLESLMP